MARGGARVGAGRKDTGRKKINYYITEEEDQFLRAGLAKLRAKEHQKTHTELIERVEDNVKKTGEIMKMLNCKHLQAWNDQVKEVPLVGQTVWCVWCQAMEKIEKVL